MKKERKKYSFKQTAAQRRAAYRQRVATRRANEVAVAVRRKLDGNDVIENMIAAENVARTMPVARVGRIAEEQSGAEPQMAGDGLVGGLPLHATLETLVDHYSVRDIMETLTGLIRGHLGTGPATTRAPQLGFESKR